MIRHIQKTEIEVLKYIFRCRLVFEPFRYSLFVNYSLDKNLCIMINLLLTLIYSDLDYSVRETRVRESWQLVVTRVYDRRSNLKPSYKCVSRI